MSDQIPPPPRGPSGSPFGGPYPGGPSGPGGAVPPPGFPGYGQNPPGFGQPLPYGAFPVQKSTNAYSIISLVLGVLSMFICFFGVITGVVGIVFGVVGISQSNKNPERMGGKGMAVAGIILSLIAIVFWIGLWIVADSTDSTLQ